MSDLRLRPAGDPPPGLDAAHFAFMRSVVQGVDTGESWRRYLSAMHGKASPADIRRHFQWLRDALGAQARRLGRPGVARLLALDLAAERNSTNRLPSLADFIRDQELDGFSEAEQVFQFQQLHGVHAARQARQTRLLARQLEALHWLQVEIRQTTVSADTEIHLIATWLDPRLAARLAGAGLHDMRQLIALVDRRSARWWTGIRGIGTAKAARISDMLVAYAALIARGTSAGSGTAVGDTPQGRALRLLPTKNSFVSLQHLRLPVDLKTRSTQDGLPRAPTGPCQIAATSDVEALRTWLHAKRRIDRQGADGLPDPLPGARPPHADVPGWEILSALSHTQRAYWKEAERFFLWLVLERRMTLSAASATVCADYADFLADPAPHWCGARGHGKNHPLWRPFEGPLTTPTRQFALNVLRGLYQFLVEKKYLHCNPWQRIDPTTAFAGGRETMVAQKKRAFSATAWQCIDSMLSNLPSTSANARLKTAVLLLRFTGLRIGEAVCLRVEDLSQGPKPGGTWRLQYRRPDNPGRTVAMPAVLSAQLQRYFAARGLDPDFTAAANNGAFLLGRATDAVVRAPWAPCARGFIDVKAGIAAGSLRDQIKQFFALCARARPELAAEFKRATSHWLRFAH